MAGLIKNRLGIDDSLDVFATHGVGGMLGSLLVAVFALPALGGSGYGHAMSAAGQIGAQAMGVAAAMVWSAVWTFLIVKVLAATIWTRVSLEQEREGLVGDRNGDGVLVSVELSSEDLIRPQAAE